MTLTAEEINKMEGIYNDTISKVSHKQIMNNHSFDEVENLSYSETRSEKLLSDSDISEMDKIADITFSSEKTSVFDGLSEEEKKLYQLDSNVNFNVLNSMPELPDEVLGLYGLKKKELKQYFDADQWKQWEAKGKVGIAEAWNKKKKLEMIPWVGTSADTAKTINLAITANRIKNGQEIRPEDEEALRQYILHTAEMEARGGYTIGGGIVDIATGSVPYIVEFGAGLGSAGIDGVGLGIIASTLAKGKAQKLAKEQLKKEVQKQILPVIGSSMKFGVTKMPQHFAHSIADRQLTTGVAITPVGDVVFSDSENFALSFFKALGDSTFETMSETAGGLISPAIKYFAKPIRNALPKSFYKNFEKAVSTKFGGVSCAEVLKKYGYDGVIEEMGEELLNRLLCQTFGLNGLKSYNLDGFLNNVLYADNPSMWASEAGAFLLTSVIGHGLVKTASLLTSNEAIKKKYNADNLYLDQGLVRVKGSKSLAQQELEKILKQNNVPEKTISNYFATHTETDFRQALYEFKSSEINKEKTDAEDKLEAQANEVKDTVYKMLTQKGMDSEQADAISKLFKARSKIATKWSDSPIAWFNNLGLEFNNAKNNQKDNAVSFNQGRQEVPKYIEENKKVAATNRHYEGGETSPKINKILDFVREGNSLEATVQKFQTKDFDDGRITKIYNDFQNGVYKYVEGTPERVEKKKVLNPEYVPLFNGTEEKTNEIIEHYEENTSTDKVGHGYSGYSMSNNAKTAYDKGSMPLSKWSKKNIIERIKNIVENYDIPFDVSKLDKMTVKDIKSKYLKQDGYHHTSKFYNTTEFYKVDIEKILENKENTEGKYLISDENKTEIQGYKNFVNKVFKQKLTNKEKSKPYIIGNTPKSLTEAGLSNDKLAIGFSIIEKAKNEKNNDHKLSETTIENIVEALHNPIAVIKDEIKRNEKSNNRYGIILDLKENDNFVMVSIESGKNLGSGNIVNDIRTIHSRKSFAPMINKAVNTNRLLKIKESKLKDLLLGYQSDSISDGGQTSLINIIKQKYKNTNILFQIGYHGGAKDFDKFDLSYALSGEGAMAHGYGVYTAKNKEVSEGYRKRLLPYDFDNIGMQITVNHGVRDIIYTKKATNTYRFSEDGIFEKRPDDYLNTALLYIEKTNNDKQKAIKQVQEKIDNYRENGNISNARFYLEVKEMLQSYDFDITQNPEGMGQLFEVDIPEDDVLLDEDLPLSKQPQKVQEAIKKLINTIVGNSTKEELENKFDEIQQKLREGAKKSFAEFGYDEGKKLRNELHKIDSKIVLLKFLDQNNKYYTGKDIYNAVSLILGSKKNASEKLNEYGIKGIKYDGRQDGECVVVFDDKAVEIIQKFYQGREKQLQRKDGKVIDVEYYDNSYIQEVAPLDIKNLKFSNISNVKDIKKKDIANEVFDDKEKIYIKNSKSKINASLSLNSLKKIISTIYRPEKENAYTRLEKEIITNIETIFENAIPVLKHAELKRKSLFDVQIVHRFALPIKIGNSNFLTMITVKERKDFEELELDEFTIYDLKSEMENKKTLDRYSMSEDSKESGQSRSQVLNYSMNDIIEFVNSNLAKYKVTLNKGGKNENDIDYTDNIYNKVKLENKEQFDEFVDNFHSEETRASITFENKALNEPKAIIDLFENADKSSFLHEMAHLFLQDIIIASKTNDEAKKELERINEYLGHTSGQYTVQEHEKWAKGFEIYLINGKAPNAGLKTAYDTFKTWLREIYNFVLASNGTLSKDVFSVYDSLFKDYKPDEMEVVKSIVSNAIRTANNASEGKYTLNDEQKRYKETAYEILSVALKKKVAYLKTILENRSNSKSMIKKKEKLEEQIVHIDDQISSADGMLPAWREFFPDYGNEAGSDYNLASKAYEVIINKTYLDYDVSYDESYIDSALFDKLERAYKHILNIYKNGDEKQKDYAVAAMYEWLENNLPNETYQTIFSEMFTHDFREIERRSNLDKFELAKESIANSAQMLNNYKEQKNFNELVINTLNGLSFLTANDKTKIFNSLMQYENSEDLRNDLDNIMDIAKILDSENYFKTVEAKIQKALAGTKNIKRANKTVGKYNFDINQVFSDLRRYNNMTKERAQQELETVIDFEGEETEAMSFEDKLRHKFLYYKATPSMYISSDFISDLYKDIITLKNWGYLAKEREKLLKKVDIKIKIENLLRVLDGKKKANKLIRGYIQAFGNWESALNAIFNNKVKEEYSLLDKEAKVQNWQHKQKQEFLAQALEIFGVNQYKFDNLIIDKLSEKYKFIEHGAKRNHEIELNKLNIIQAYIWAKNDVLKERLERQFGVAGLAQMFAKLDNEEIEFANLMQRTAAKFYNEANKVYIRKYGVELPRVQNYFPSQTERVSTVDFLADFVFQSSTSPSFIKNRVKSRMPMMRFSNPLTTLFGHIDKMGVFIHMTDVMDMYNKIFTDSDIKKRIISLYGEKTYQSFGTILANSSYQKQGVKIDSINEILNKMVNNFISANIILKPSIAIKQLLSTVNYAESMPVGTWCVGFLKALANPKATIDFMMRDEYLRTRLETGGQNEYLKNAIEHSMFAKTRKFTDFLSLNVRLGDMGAIVFGGKPYIDYLINEKGMTKENAFKEFRLSTMRSQQASMASSLSNFQNNFTNPWLRGAMAFRNTPNQYFRKVIDAIISYSNGCITAKQCGKIIFIYTFLNQFMYNIATSLSGITWATGGDDGENLFKDVIKSIFDFNSQAVPILGDLWSYFIDRLLGTKRSGDVGIPAITDLFDIVEQLTADDVTLEDWLESLASFGDVSTGLPVQSAFNMGAGAVDVVTGKPASGALRMLGYTKYRAEKTTNTEDKQ